MMPPDQLLREAVLDQFEHFANLANYLLASVVYGRRARQSSFILW